ncbi:MAG: DUF58 domain-containing protein [Propionibacteriaceae bacterium]|nr:DUF58 domain-containing protein [Propionibacteriaceae bacterium]
MTQLLPGTQRRRTRAARASRTGLPGRVRGWIERGTEAARGLLRFRFVAATWSYLRGVTPLGWGGFAVAVLAGLAWLRYQWAEAQVVAVALALLCLAGLAWSIGRTEYRVGLRLASVRVSVGDRALGEVTIANAAKRTLKPAVVEMPVGNALAAFRVPRLGVSEAHEEAFTIPTHRRGVIVVGPVTSVRGDALGFVRRVQRWSDPVSLFVHPRTIGLDSATVGFIRDIEGATTQELSSSDVSFHALRDYIPGDDRRNVHWRTTARTGRLMVRQFEETRRAHLLLLVDVRSSSWDSEDAFETGISAAASLAMAAMRDHRELSVMTQHGVFSTPSPMRVLDQFSAVEADPGCPSLADLAREASERVPGASVAVLVTGANTPVGDLHRAQSWLPVNMVTMALRCVAGEEPHRRQVGGLSVISIGELEQLPLALRRALG